MTEGNPKTMTAQVAKPTRKRRAGGKVDHMTAIELKAKGLTYKQIGQMYGCSKQSIHQAIRNLVPTQQTHIFKQTRADVFSELQRKLLVSIDDADIKKAPIGSRILAVAQIYDKERLERNLSTSNTASIRADIAMLKGLKPDAQQQNYRSTKPKKQSTKEIKQIEG